MTWVGDEVDAGDQFVDMQNMLGAWLWDAESATFLTFFPGAPTALNSLETLTNGDVLWVRVSQDTSWSYLPIPKACEPDPDLLVDC